jgi:hypothetical protein
VVDRVGPDEVRGQRVARQLLVGERAGDVVGAVRAVVAVQGQAAMPARLAVRARTTGVTAADVDRAVADRAVVRTWAMRGTLHLLAADDVAWVRGLLGPVFDRAGARRRAQLGLTDAVCAAGLAAIEQVLTGTEPLIRADLVARIAEHGVRLDPKSQAPAHLLMHAANQGLICRGPDAAKDEPTYVLLADWLGPAAVNRFPDRADALAVLARGYRAGYAPATAADYATWSGLSRTEAKQAFAAVDAVEVGTADGLALVPAGPVASAEPRPRLLGHFDALLLGYRDRALVLDPEHAKQVQAGGGFIQPTVLVDGRVAGTWRLERSARRITVGLEPFTRLPAAARDALRAEAEDIGRFLGVPEVRFG